MRLSLILGSISYVLASTLDTSQPVKRDSDRLIVVGYRMVAQPEYDNIIDNGRKLVASDGLRGRQLGEGIYLSPKFGVYNKKAEKNDDGLWLYDCVIEVKESLWNGLPKAWVPRWWQPPEGVEIVDTPSLGPYWDQHSCGWQFLYWGPGGNDDLNPATRVSWLSSLSPPVTEGQALLFSYVQGSPGLLQQVVIPSSIITTNDWQAQQCARRGSDQWDDLMSRAVDINWNVEGLAGWRLPDTYEGFLPGLRDPDDPTDF